MVIFRNVFKMILQIYTKFLHLEWKNIRNYILKVPLLRSVKQRVQPPVLNQIRQEQPLLFDCFNIYSLIKFKATCVTELTLQTFKDFSSGHKNHKNVFKKAVKNFFSCLFWSSRENPPTFVASKRSMHCILIGYIKLLIQIYFFMKF